MAMKPEPTHTNPRSKTSDDEKQTLKDNCQISQNNKINFSLAEFQFFD
jgi:hypothetical protein